MTNSSTKSPVQGSEAGAEVHLLDDWFDYGMEEPVAAGLPAAHQAGRFADRRRLSCRYQHASGAPVAVSRVRRRSQQGHGEPGMAQGKGRLGPA